MFYPPDEKLGPRGLLFTAEHQGAATTDALD